MKYNYKARKPSGQIFQGIVEAADENTAADILIDRGIAIISIEEVSRVEYDSEKHWYDLFIGVEEELVKEMLILPDCDESYNSCIDAIWTP